MDYRLKISFCTVAMNRLHHLQSTLIRNIIDNQENATGVEFVLLDYNSADGLEAWIKNECSEYVEAGVLKYYKTETPAYFDRSHSRNMAFKLATGDVLCNVDADNFLGYGFAGFVRGEFEKKSALFLITNSRQKDTIGRVCVKKEDFYAVNGYNEKFEGYGFEDMEFYTRLTQHDLKPVYFSQPEFLKVISHSDAERTANDFKSSNIYRLFINYINPTRSELMFLYNNNRMETGILIDEVVEGINIFGPIDQNKTSFFGSWTNGYWEKEDDLFTISTNAATHHAKFRHEAGILTYNNKLFYAIADSTLINDIQHLCSGIKNRNIRDKSRIDPDGIINQTGFGQGMVSKNFGQQLINVA